MCVQRSNRSFLLMQIALLLSFLMQIASRFWPHSHPDVPHAAQGFFLGTAIGLLWKHRRRTV